MKKLEWNVLIIDLNSNKATKFNVFDSYNFSYGLSRIKKEVTKRKLDITNLNKQDYEWFSALVNRYAMYSFWGKFEYELFIAPLHLSIPLSEVNRIKELAVNNNKAGKILLQAYEGEKIDVYTQLKLNWDLFIKYILDNFKKVKSKI